jgi:hypothetical protein
VLEAYIAASVFGVLFVAGLYLARGRAQSRDRRAEALAAELGGRCENGVLRLEVEGVPLTIWLGRGDSTTRVFATQAGLIAPFSLKWSHPSGPDLAEPLVVDQTLRLDSDDPALARLWLSPAVRSRLLQLPPGYMFQLERGHVHVDAQAADADAGRLRAGARAVAAFVERGRELKRAWGEAARMLGGSVADADGEQWLPGPASTVTIAATSGRLGALIEVVRVVRHSWVPRWRTATRVETARRSGQEPFALADDETLRDLSQAPVFEPTPALPVPYRARSEDPARTGPRLTQRVAALLEHARPDQVIADRVRVAAEVEGVLLDAGRLTALYTLVTLLGGGSEDIGGPYR